MTLPVPDPLWLAAAPGVIAVGLWAVADLQRFVLFAVLAAMILPQALFRPGGTQVALADLLLLLALAAWLVSRAAGESQPVQLSRNRLLIAALLFVAINAQSVAWSVHPQQTVVFAIQLFELVVIFPVVFASVPRSMDVIERGLTVFVGVTCVLAIAYMAGVSDRLSGGLGKNTVGSFLAAGLVMTYALMLAKRSIVIQRLLGIALVVDLAGLIATASRGSIVGALIALGAMSFLLRRRRLLTVGIVLALGVGFVAIYGTDSRDARTRTITGSYDTSTVRGYAYRNAVDKIEQRPFLGSGAGTYEDYIQELELPVGDPTNMFLLTWAEIGVFGLLALVLLLGQYLWLMFDVRKLPPEDAAVAVGAGCVALSLLVHFQFDVTWTQRLSGAATAETQSRRFEVAQRRASRSGSPTRPAYSTLQAAREPVAK